MFRFKSAERLRAFFTSAYPKRLFRPNALLRSSSPALMYSSRGGGVLPSELSRSVVRLTCDSTAKGGICNVYLIGTFPYHPIEEDFRERNRSCYNVKVAIKSLKPQVVFLGLCPSLSHDLKPDQMLMRIDGKLFDQELSNMMEWGLNLNPDGVPDHRILKSFRYNQSYVKKFYVDECAQYMSATLLKVACEHTTVVAVVSNLYLSGIQKHWKQHIEVEDLLGGTWPVAPLVRKVVLLFLLCYFIHII